MILVKTEVGRQVLKDRSVQLTPRQRSAFILFDGRRSVAEVLASGTGVAQEDVDQLVDLGLLGQPAPDEGTAPSPQPPGPAAAVPVEIGRERYRSAYPIATQLTASLGLRGFRLNLAVEAASTYEELAALAPKIRAAVGPEKAQPLERALAG